MYNGWTNYATWRVKLEIWDDVRYFEDWNGKVSPDYLQETTEEYLRDNCSNNTTFSYAMAFINDVNWYEIADSINDDLGLQGHFGQGTKKKRKFFGKSYDTGGLFNLFPDLTKNARTDLVKALKKGQKELPKGTELAVLSAVSPEVAMLSKLNNYKLKNKPKKAMNGTCNGFSRVVVPSKLNGFSRVNMELPQNVMQQGYTLNDYELDGYTLNGRTARRVGRWYKKNAPWSYIGTAVAGLVVADIMTKGAVRKKLGLKK